MLHFHHVIHWLRGELVTKSVIYPIFELNAGSYELKLMFVNEDGKLTIDGEDFTFAELAEGVGNGAVVTSPSKGFELYVPHVVSLRCETVIDVVPNDAFLLEVQDLINWLSNSPTSLERCRNAFVVATQNPTASNIEMLREAYRAVPIHLRCYLLGFDEKDSPIRQLIGEDKC